MPPPPSIAVIGAGAVGLSCAVQIQDAVEDCRVTVVADKFTKDTCSDGAAGVFRPSPEKMPGTDIGRIMKWLRSSWDHYDKLAHSAEGAEAGVHVLAAYHFSQAEKQPSVVKDLLYEHRQCTEKELNMFPGPRFKHGFRTTTLMTEGRRYLPYLMKRFREKNGKVVCRKVKSLEEFVGEYDMVVVCTGFQSKYLLGDSKVYSSRGHLIRVQAPWIKQAIYVEDSHGNTTYIYPGADNVAVGGTRQRGDEDETIRQHEHTAIWERACQIVPSLKSATMLWDWVGLRPYREPLRLETDVLEFNMGSLPVVYNYGHGGDGISLSWGTAVEATQLLIQQLTKIQKLSKQ